MRKISPSQISEFCSCRRKWYIKRMLMVPNSSTTYQLYGIITHEFLELYHKGVSLEMLLDEFDARIRELKDTDMKLFRSVMTNYVDFDNKMYTKASKYSIPRITDVDVKFLFETEISDESFADQGFVIEGRPDLLYLKGNNLVIIDHKTTDRRWNDEMFNISSPIRIYHMIASRLFSGYDVQAMFNVLIKTSGARTEDKTSLFQRAYVDSLNVRDTMEQVKHILDDINRTDYYPYKSDGAQCSLCYYSDICAAGDSLEQATRAIDMINFYKGNAEQW